MTRERLNLKGEVLYLENTRPAGTALNFLELDHLRIEDINAIYLSYLNVLLLGNEILKLKRMNQIQHEEIIIDFIKQPFCIPSDVINDLERKKEYRTLLGTKSNNPQDVDLVVKTIDELLDENASKAYSFNYHHATNEYLKAIILKSSIERFSRIFESTIRMFLNFESKLNIVGKKFEFYDSFTANIENVCHYYFCKNNKNEKEIDSVKKLYCLFNEKINFLISRNFFINQFISLGIDKFDFGQLDIDAKSFKKNKSLSFNFNLFFDSNYNFNNQLADAFSQFDLKNKKTLMDYYIHEHKVENTDIDQCYLDKIKNQILVDYDNNKPVLIYAKKNVGKKSFIQHVFKNIDKKIYLISSNDLSNIISEEDLIEILIISSQKDDHIFVFDDHYYEKFKGLINTFVNNFHIIVTNNNKNNMIFSDEISFYNINSIPTYIKLNLLKKLIHVEIKDEELNEISLMVKDFDHIKKLSDKINYHEMTIEQTIKNLKANNPLLNSKKQQYFYYSENQNDKINKIESLFHLKQKSDDEKIKLLPKGFVFFGLNGNGQNALLNEVSRKLNTHLIRFDLSTISDHNSLITIKNEILDHSPCIVVFDGYMSFEKLNAVLHTFDKLNIDCCESVFILNTYDESMNNIVLSREFKNITNYPKRFYFNHLSLSERKIFLQQLCEGILTNKDTDLLAEITEGVKISELVNFSLTLKYHKEIEQKDISLDEARDILDHLLIGEETTDLYLPSNKSEREESQYKTAIHEMGHALLGLKYNMDLTSVSVVSRSYYLGVTRFNSQEFGYKTTLSKLKEDIEVTMGGLIAEQLFFNEHELGVSCDMRMVNDTLEKIFSIGQSDVNLDTGDIFVFNSNPAMFNLLSENDKEEISNRKRAILRECLLSATAFLKENKALLEKTAKLLKEKRCLYKEDIDLIRAEIKIN